MTDKAARNTPTDVSEFERAQLRFFLEQGNAAHSLAELNPSLSWLAEIVKLNLLESATELIEWIQKNFNDPEAIREVVRNIDFFDYRSAQPLEWAFGRNKEKLDPIIAKCWQLIIRHIRNTRHGELDDWFEIGPQIKAGDFSTELFERLVNALKPTVRVGKSISLEEEFDPKQVLLHPSDLMTIKYEVRSSVRVSDVLAALPEVMPPEAKNRLLKSLSDALSSTLNDATECEIESNSGYSVTDSDVPSIAAHEQNKYRKGFQKIVRVIAEVWTQLASKDASAALAYIEMWSNSSLKLNNRLALYGAANGIVPAEMVAQTLLSLSHGLLFFTNSSVEVNRLIFERWMDLSLEDREKIELRIIEGPPESWLRDNVERNVDRARFDLLGNMERTELQLGEIAKSTLDEIRSKYAEWQLRPADQAGFRFWSSGAREIVGDHRKLNELSAELLVAEAKKMAEEADFLEGDNWQALCQNEPDIALAGLEANANRDDWPTWAWHPFLWATKNQNGPVQIELVVKLLIGCPDPSFRQISDAASWWLNEKSQMLDWQWFWKLWDKVYHAAVDDNVSIDFDDILHTAINAPAGRLTEALIKKIPGGVPDEDLPPDIVMRLNLLVSAPGSFGALARVSLANHVSFLFECAPDWTGENVVPLFDWHESNAKAAWQARKFSSYIGSPALFEATKTPFLELFGRPDMTEEDKDVFASWLTAIVIANKTSNAGYPISTLEARSAMRVAGDRALTSVGHRLAIEMESAESDEKQRKWDEVVRPVFQAIWPLDAELQSPSATFKLVQILRATGEAFSDAADVIIPYVRPEGPRDHTSLFSLSEASDEIYSSSPEKMLELINAIVGEESPGAFYGLNEILERLINHAPEIANTRKFQRLQSTK